MKDLGEMWTSGKQEWTKGHALPTRDQVYSWVRKHRAAQACLEELPRAAAKEPRKRKIRTSVAEANKQSQAKVHYCLVLKTAMNNLKKALENRQYPVFVLQ